MAMMLVAFDNKLGTCWVGAFREERELTRILNLPMNLKPVVIIPVGYPSKIPPPPRRVSREEAVEFRISKTDKIAFSLKLKGGYLKVLIIHGPNLNMLGKRGGDLRDFFP